MSRKHKDEKGNQYGRLSVVSRSENDKHGNARWECQCECGNSVVVLGRSLRNGATRSCGCLQAEKKVSHGMYGSKEYSAWCSMKSRCDNPNDKNYKNYGGRGIRYCETWGEFPAFHRDMGDAPNGSTIERIDNSKGYSKGNCKWASYHEQNNNRRGVIKLDVKGEQMTISDVCAKFGLSRYAVVARLRAGWPVDKIISTPQQRSHA